MKGRIIMKNGMIVNEYGTKYWYKNDLLHRTEGPAVIYSDGAQAWFFEGKQHRVDGPAIIDSDGSKFWYFEDKLHRTDGPAIIYSDGSVCWYLHGKPLTYEEYLAAVSVVSSISVNDHICPTCKRLL
jgi:hypothetical protein